jgi:hypothetical protein
VALAAGWASAAAVEALDRSSVRAVLNSMAAALEWA